MFPPVDDAVLQNNPDFAALYKTLTTAVLNPDGSTKNDAAAKERDAVQEELNKHRLEAAKHHLLIHALSTANPSAPATKPAPALPRRAAGTTKPPPPRPQPTADLPPALVDLLLLLPAFLTPTGTTPLTPSQLTTLLSHPPFSLLPSLLPDLAALVSSALHASATAFARLAHPATNPSFIHRAIPALPSHYTTLTASLATQKAFLAESRLDAAAALTGLLEDHAVVTAHLLRALEAKHGPIARSLEFRATETMLAAQKQAAEVEAAMWRVRRELYTPDVRRALMAYARHLRDARGRLGEGVRARRGELVGERKMKEMARVKREMEKQLEEVREDLERLGRA
ncbi:hypothetical protein B0T18DRAFT_439908 [Schizothecium vesticola]|uniref:Uncharacterized protein n=1 Tax=Schizothecium vesticola TaxID=314040 RepID=A0AA40EID4_9PEZI|nr:hypothetical protein B0T18DRAFT_439908 [Schizothecium vesticola]